MKTFREMCDGKPSKAIRAMLDGIEAIEARDDFRLVMGTWLGVDDRRCCGCAATAAVMHCTGKSYTAADARKAVDAADHGWNGFKVRASAQGVDADDLVVFESAINTLRYANLVNLGAYFRVELPAPVDDLWILSDTGGWREYLGGYEAYAKQLEEAGL